LGKCGLQWRSHENFVSLNKIGEKPKTGRKQQTAAPVDLQREDRTRPQICISIQAPRVQKARQVNSNALISDGAINITSTSETQWREDKQEDMVMSGYKLYRNESRLCRWRS